MRRLQAACVLATLLATVATLALSSAFPEAAGAAPTTCPAGTPQCLVATPATQLADGQFVKLSFAGFAPNIALAFRQCVANAKSPTADCTPVNTSVAGNTDANGAGETFLPIAAGNNIPNDAGKTITCDATNPCVVEGMVDPNSLSTAVAAPLQFAKSGDDCPAFPADGLLGSGSASAFRAIDRWEFSVCTPPASIAIDYTLKSSPDGVFNFQSGLTDFGVTGPFQTPPTAGPGGVPFKLAPLTTSGVVLAFRMYDLTGPQITSITLTPDLIAQIFSGSIPNWAVNKAIAALNPNVQFPPRIIPFARAEASAQTLVFTSWLAATAPTSWTGGPQEIFPLPPAGVTGKTGSAGVGFGVADPRVDYSGQGNIGYMDASTAAFYGLPTVTIKQSDGSLINATPDTITHAIVDSKISPDGTLALDYSHPTPTDYPMPMPTYMIVPTATTTRLTTARGGKLAAFLRYAVNGGQGVLPEGYAPLTPTLVSESLAVADAIPQPPPPTPTPSPTARATPSPTPTPAPVRVVPVTPFPAPLLATGPLPTLAAPRTLTAATPCASATAKARASASPTAASAAPSQAASTSPPHASASASTLPCTGAGAGTVTPSPRPVVGVNPIRLNLSHIADSTFVRFVLPPLFGLGVLGLIGGAGLEIFVRRRGGLDTAGALSAGDGGG